MRGQTGFRARNVRQHCVRRYVYLPESATVRPLKQGQRGLARHPPSIHHRAETALKALLIEDTLTSATLVSHQLRKIGIEPVLARDGEKGIELFKKEHPDLILLDIMMPGMDGFEVARRIRQLEQAGEWTPIIFLTARTSDADLEKGISVGGDDYLIKPVSEIVLAAKVRAMQRIAQMRYSLLILTRKLDHANQELTRLSSLDGLTGIPNRRQFDETLLREWRRACRQGKPLCQSTGQRTTANLHVECIQR